MLLLFFLTHSRIAWLFFSHLRIIQHPMLRYCDIFMCVICKSSHSLANLCVTECVFDVAGPILQLALDRSYTYNILFWLSHFGTFLFAIDKECFNLFVRVTNNIVLLSFFSIPLLHINSNTLVFTSREACLCCAGRRLRRTWKLYALYGSISVSLIVSAGNEHFVYVRCAVQYIYMVYVVPVLVLGSMHAWARADRIMLSYVRITHINARKMPAPSGTIHMLLARYLSISRALLPCRSSTYINIYTYSTSNVVYLYVYI